MTYPEYEAKIREIVANPDSLATASVDLLEEIRKDTDTLASIHAQNEAHTKKIRELQDANYQLFLRVTGQPSDGMAPEQTSDTPLNDMLARMFGADEKKED